MEIQFRKKRLRKQYQDVKAATREYGAEVARLYIGRINIIKSAKDIKVLTSLPGLKCHELKGDRRGEWAINLTGFWRLIFTLIGEQLEIVCIEEVSKHYGD